MFLYSFVADDAAHENLHPFDDQRIDLDQPGRRVGTVLIVLGLAGAALAALSPDTLAALLCAPGG